MWQEAGGGKREAGGGWREAGGGRREVHKCRFLSERSIGRLESLQQARQVALRRLAQPTKVGFA